MKPAALSEVDQLAKAAAAADAGAPLDVGAALDARNDTAAPGVPVDMAKEWAQFPALFGQLVTPALPELRTVYTDEACMAWGRAMVPLADKYGWTPGEFMQWLGPWAGVAMATWPLAWPTVKAIKARRAVADLAAAAPNDRSAAPDNVVHMHGDDPDFRDPAKANPPPRPV